MELTLKKRVNIIIIGLCMAVLVVFNIFMLNNYKYSVDTFKRLLNKSDETFTIAGTVGSISNTADGVYLNMNIVPGYKHTSYKIMINSLHKHKYAVGENVNALTDKDQNAYGLEEDMQSNIKDLFIIAGLDVFLIGTVIFLLINIADINARIKHPEDYDDDYVDDGELKEFEMLDIGEPSDNNEFTEHKIRAV